MDASNNLTILLLESIKTSHNLTPTEIVWINTFIEASPSIFNDIIGDIKMIISDGKVNLQDVPQIIKLLSDVYKSSALSTNLHNPKNIILIVKLTIDVILNSSLLPLSDAEKQHFREIADSSLTLLSMNLDIETKVCCNLLNFWHK